MNICIKGMGKEKQGGKIVYGLCQELEGPISKQQFGHVFHTGKTGVMVTDFLLLQPLAHASNVKE